MRISCYLEHMYGTQMYYEKTYLPILDYVHIIYHTHIQQPWAEWATAKHHKLQFFSRTLAWCASLLWMSKEFHKKSAYQTGRPDIPADKRLRQNISDLFLSGEVSAKRARLLLEDAAAANACGAQDLQTADGPNIHRDLLRKLKKSSKWPPMYTTVKDADGDEFLFASP